MQLVSAIFFLLTAAARSESCAPASSSSLLQADVRVARAKRKGVFRAVVAAAKLKTPQKSRLLLQPALTTEEILQFHEAFLLFDANQNGMISASELKDVMSQVGQTSSDREVQRLWLNSSSQAFHAI